MTGELKFDMVELKSGEKKVATKIGNSLFLAFHPEPISEVFDDDYVRKFISSLRDKDNSTKIYEDEGIGLQTLIRLSTKMFEMPWWAPVMIYRIPIEHEADDILVVLHKYPKRINHYK